MLRALKAFAGILGLFGILIGSGAADAACQLIITMSARTVAGDPFWKAVRPNGVPPEAKLKGNIVTARTFTTCFTGVVVPYVCTSGSAVCGN
jgi:hypothetical protein